MITLHVYNLAKSTNNVKGKDNQEFANLRYVGSEECRKVRIETMVDRATNT